MYLNKKQKGYGWYSKVSSKDLNSNEEKTAYLNFSFKKDCEPDVDNLEGDLFFIDKQGNKRKVFPIVNEYQGNVRVDFKLLEIQDNSNFSGKYSNSGKSINIGSDDLPFI